LFGADKDPFANMMARTKTLQGGGGEMQKVYRFSSAGITRISTRSRLSALLSAWQHQAPMRVCDCAGEYKVELIVKLIFPAMFYPVLIYWYG
jgi:hypothetical protein